VSIHRGVAYGAPVHFSADARTTFVFVILSEAIVAEPKDPGEPCDVSRGFY
jgi:hypothetical protein